MTTPSIPDPVRQTPQQQPDLAFAVLVGSRATGTQRPGSDWDNALQWAPTVDAHSALGATETLRRQLAHALQQSATAVDLIDRRRANLAMRAMRGRRRPGPAHRQRSILGTISRTLAGANWSSLSGSNATLCSAAHRGAKGHEPACEWMRSICLADV